MKTMSVSSALKSIAVASVMTGAVLGGATVAAADPGGASFSLHRCTPIPNPRQPGWTLCVDSKGERNTTVTPSGNTSVEANGTDTYTTIDPTAVVQRVFTYDFHQHDLIKSGVVQESQSKTIATFTQGGNTYCFGYNYHFANGQVQIDELVNRC